MSLSVVTGPARQSGSVTDTNATLALTRAAALAWAAPAVGLVVVAAAVTIPMVASASPVAAAPVRRAAAGRRRARPDETPLSGTVVETARLGLPALPEVGGTSISPTALLAGSHTARVWYDGADKARIALVGNLAETDLVRNGRDVWLWTSGAEHRAARCGCPAKTARRDVAVAQSQPAESVHPAAGRASRRSPRSTRRPR